MNSLPMKKAARAFWKIAAMILAVLMCFGIFVQQTLFTNAADGLRMGYSNFSFSPAANSDGWHRSNITITALGASGGVSTSSTGPFSGSITLSNDTDVNTIGLFFSNGERESFTYALDKGYPVIQDVVQSGNTIYVDAWDDLSGVKSIEMIDSGGNSLFPADAGRFRIASSGIYSIVVTDYAGNQTAQSIELTYSNTSSSGSGGSGGSGISGFSRSDSTRGTTLSGTIDRSSQPDAPPSYGPISADQAVTETQRALVNMAAAGGTTAVVNIKNPSSISLEAMQEMVKTAGSYGVMLNADTTNPSVSQALVRMSFYPAQATRGVNLTASTTSSGAQSIKGFFETWYTNRFAVVCTGQTESFGMPVEMAVFVGADFDASKAKVYTYDTSNNTYLPVSTWCWMDSVGYIHFTVYQGGNLVISEGALAAR